MESYDIRKTNQVRRLKDRASYDKTTVHSILDAAPICHVGFTLPPDADSSEQELDFPMVIPMLHARVGESVYLHGYVSSRLIKVLGADKDPGSVGVPTCITATLMDGLVYSLNPFHNSMNYRSAVIFGACYLVVDEEEKVMALKEITEKLTPGRWDDGIIPTTSDVKSTGVVRVQIISASAKIRAGPNKDDKKDLEHEAASRVWTGVVPIRTVYETPVAGPTCKPGIKPPGYILKTLEDWNAARPMYP
ncbi:hypothetical protein BC829DRAFT_386116 [Chytridium lagenaria]|nr:hypothetical protein BC829DRAFT_386116 [Chytridium lagenaria]